MFLWSRCGARGHESGSLPFDAVTGTYNCTLYNCSITDNSGIYAGGGAYLSQIYNSYVSKNSAESGGGTDQCTINNSTIVNNLARHEGGGARACTLNNCIVYYNTAPVGANYKDASMNYCCTTPLADGPGNILGDPSLASLSHLGSTSPCIGAGSTGYTSGVDIDFEPWANPPSIGCDEVNIGAVTGNLRVAISSPSTNVAVSYAMAFEANVDGRTTGSRWSFGDGTPASTNRPIIGHAFAAPGNYAVALQAFSESHPGGVAATVNVAVAQAAVHYVRMSNSSPSAPFSSWATAATNIQTAIDAATQAGAVVLVSNGVFATGGKSVRGTLTNRVAVDKPIIVRSVNGPGVTTIKGSGPLGTSAVRCVYLGSNAVLSGFHLSDGYTRIVGSAIMENSGGGAWCEATGALTNCVLTGNSARLDATGRGGATYGGILQGCTISGNWAYEGGGAALAVLSNCRISGNSASTFGGGSYVSTLDNCTIADNAAGICGGSAYSVMNNCIVYFNTANSGPNYNYSVLNSCCTTPMPDGFRNITNDPDFVDRAISDYRLMATSKCIDAGTNQTWMTDAVDLDGNPRVVNWIPDMGAHEYQSIVNPDTDGDGIPNSWEGPHGLDPSSSNAPTANADGDPNTDWEEYVADSDPLDASSYWRVVETGMATPSGLAVRFVSSTNRIYTLLRTTNVADRIWTVVSGQGPRLGVGGLDSLQDTNVPPVHQSRIYRVDAQVQ